MPKHRYYSSKRIQSKAKSNKVRLFLAVGGALALIISAFFVFQKTANPLIPEVTGEPSLKVDKENVDLGDVKLGNNAEVSFEMTNVGNQPLVFTKAPYIEVKEGC